MITIITGSPGAGKTLYTVQEILRKIVGTTVTDPDTGAEYKRTIYTNINGLMLDHELIDGGDNGGLNDWHKWAKPGSVIVFDEVQKPWPPRPNGSKVPDAIQALETHRHMGVDFVMITQGPMLVERNLLALAGQHLHLRRIASTRTCIVYEWDHVSRSLMYSKAISKKFWRYDKAVFKLYKSAMLHTKVKRRLPGLLWFLAAAVGLAVYKGPDVYDIFARDRTQPLEVQQASAAPQAQHADYRPPAQPSAVAGAVDERKDFVPAVLDRPWTAPAFDHLRAVVDMPYPDGGICFKGECSCYRDTARLNMSSDACRKWMASRPHNPYRVPEKSAPAPVAQVSLPVGGTKQQ